MPPERVEIRLSNFKFAPAVIALRHGRRYDLRFVNDAAGGHDFVAKDFFAHAVVDSADRTIVGHGELELSGDQSLNVHLLAPAPGRYEAHCSHFLHSTFGMKAMIVID